MKQSEIVSLGMDVFSTSRIGNCIVLSRSDVSRMVLNSGEIGQIQAWDPKSLSVCNAVDIC